MSVMEQLWVVGATAYAMMLGGAIGYERELKNRPAGFRTHMLVAGASSLLIGMGQLAIADPRFRMPLLINMDPMRLVEAVVAGVSFIGAGTIFASRGGKDVAGITTAASLLMVAVIGACAGLRYHLLALASAVLTLLVLVALDVFERRWRTKPTPTRNGR
ncbi:MULTISPECIES: MgtC/SapB family protein [unclassified Lysobacter]|uniref:MgtC/SapB family protein n=1 Tax=unclassified Lysobacter TaxID=2635362 RepID=UPI001BEC7AF7|nr:MULTISPECIES: MgtC/SapB family protein [unclassified Lysobacter]MBT2747476.1 MgtC/SapB family protein [Lysobacter sp. ISL-42]MBT2752722.1 MgtC/SapB family protein [Lysobacter sp. ISL-50]MBT2778379.1 MgtC/SapB family protein [Lysobacter sp. ISL-54]MBT2783897.1 MgtC/SapB family protein [Lysobacter sp. ISL-52]